MDYLIRFTQIHETFRKAEIDSIAELKNIEIEWISYTDDSPFAVIRLNQGRWSNTIAKSLVSRSVLASAIYELWGDGCNYDSLHQDVQRRSQHTWDSYKTASFRFDMDTYQGTRSQAERRDIYESFRYMAFKGRISLKTPDIQFTVFEHYQLDVLTPERILFGRFIAESDRKAIGIYNLKKRKYISTTSMDAELSLITANLALAAAGKMCYDPFMGTASFPLACAHFGSSVIGSDLDGRSIRGSPNRNVVSNFQQYGTTSYYLGGFVADLTNSPFRIDRHLDAILCDPPYGVREGLKVLGSTRAALQKVVYLADGTPAHLGKGYIPPKKSYSFERMLDDILSFSAETLVDGGRLCMWMPVAGADNPDNVETNDAPQQEHAIPTHPALKLIHHCRQDFNKWSRRLLTYRRLPLTQIDQNELLSYQTLQQEVRKLEKLQLDGLSANDILKQRANDLNDFRKRYFQGFMAPSKK